MTASPLAALVIEKMPDQSTGPLQWLCKIESFHGYIFLLECIDSPLLPVFHLLKPTSALRSSSATSASYSRCNSLPGVDLSLAFGLEQLQSEVEKPLLNFRENFKKDMKRFDHHIADLRKQLVGRYAAVEKVQSHIEACSWPSMAAAM